MHKILGQILSQFTLMPELNLVYKELFSNKGAAFFSRELRADDISYNLEFMKHNKHAIPLTCMSGDGKSHYYYTAAAEADIYKKEYVPDEPLTVRLNRDYRIDPKRVIILGHNSKCRYIMEGFNSFRNEWSCDDSREILQIMIIDSKKNLEKMDYYREYPYVIKTVEADIYDREIIVDAINSFVDDDYSTSVLILSDDTVANEDIDAEALTNLIYVQDIVNRGEGLHV